MSELLLKTHPLLVSSFSGTFTVMCYNILCDKYATRQMYGYCPNWALDWTYRKKHILQELTHYKADIISLQVCKIIIIIILVSSKLSFMDLTSKPKTK